MRSRPHAGIHSTFSVIASSAFFLKLFFPSISTNHCSVARNIIGPLHRQQWGYEWRISSVKSSAPRSSKSAVIPLFALKTNCPSNSGTSEVKRPESSTGV